MAKVDKRAERVRLLFAQIARRYDRLNRLLSLGIDRSWRRRTVQLVPPVGDGPILDVCTGTGDLALAYFRAAAPGVGIVGSDFCRPMLELGARKARALGAERIRWIEADTQRLPFPDDLFQIVCVAFGLRNVSDTEGGLREMVRVCRSGGSVAVLEFSMPRFRPLRLLYAFYFHHLLPRLGQALAANRQGAYNYLPASVSEFPQGEAMLARLRWAGLEQLRWVPLTGGIASLYVGVK